MIVPMNLRPRYLADKLLTLSLKFLLALLLKILCVIKGEEVRVTKVEVTIKKASEEKQYTLDTKKISKERSINPSELISEHHVEAKTKPNLVTGTPSELKPENIFKNIFVEQTDEEIIKNDDDDVKSDVSSDSGSESSFEEVVQECEDHHEIVSPPFEIKTSRNNNNNNSGILPIEFHWKYGGQEVIITGDFDQWQATHKMKYNPESNDFVAVIDIDSSKQHEFKFVVDGNWRLNLDLPTKDDGHGNVNNILYPLPDMTPEYKDHAIPFSQITAAY